MILVMPRFWNVSLSVLTMIEVNIQACFKSIIHQNERNESNRNGTERNGTERNGKEQNGTERVWVVYRVL